MLLPMLNRDKLPKGGSAMKVVLTSLLTDEFVNDLRESFPGVDFAIAASEAEQKAEIKDADAYLGLPSRDVLVYQVKIFTLDQALARKPSQG